ncbi:enoyl-CoA hydratase-related protein [Aureispira anguillae]|uniref:Enoyl-CoA hydratase-related protein n=1 Tax=Aureispira anguillae TaxID=2864201 RepID=A0A915YDG8_9BACT|nr:enoyl-CoA hydratase-related protein [Aureispira anguillae]BDS11087.1 enoyl-CoA hydratase-related protein [Aureispira anguillae]
MSETILVKKENGVAVLTLNRPKAFNSFNREMAFALIEALKNCAKEEEIRAIVLTGAGRAFCAGQDLKEATEDNGVSFEMILNEHYNPIVKLIRTLKKPIVAAINGVAAGAGANIAFACDMTIAKSTASFTQAFSKIGLVPDSGGTFFLPRLVGLQRATAMMMLSNKITAQEAVDMGLIYQCVEEADFESTVTKLANKLAKMPTKALGMTKELINAGLTNDLNAQLDMEGSYQIEVSESYDYQEGVNAFLEKRKPEFKGK